MKEYKINFLKSIYFIVCLIVSLIFVKYFVAKPFGDLMEDPGLFLVKVLVFVFVIGLMLGLGSSRVQVTEEGLTVIRFLRRQEINWQDITKIRRIFAFYSGYAYYIYAGKKHVWIQDMFENMGELLKLIEEKSGKKIKGEFSKDKN